MDNYPKIITKKSVFDSKFLKLYEVNLQLRNGKTRTHYNVERVPTVTVLPLTESFEVYLISQYRYLYGTTRIEAVAGTKDKGEKPLATAKRELAEEAGISAQKWDRIAEIYLAGSYIKSLVSIFLARDLTVGKANLEDDETISLIKMPLEEAVQKVLSGEISYGSAVSGILLLDRLRRDKKYDSLYV